MRYMETKDRTKLYLEAVRILCELAGAQGEDAVSRVYSEAVEDLSRDNFIKKGYRQSYSETGIQKLLGRPRTSEPCFPPGSDHDTLWLKDGKPALYLMQPYQLGWDNMQKLVRFCYQHGLRANVGTWPSFYFPGSVLSISVEKADVPAAVSGPEARKS